MKSRKERPRRGVPPALRPQGRLRVRRQRLSPLRLFGQYVAMHGKRRTDPQGIGEMIAARVGGVGMHEHAEPAMVEHQPGHQLGEDLPGKCDLIHRLVVWADLDIVPAPERHRKALADPPAQLLRLAARRCRIIVDVGVEACDFAVWPRGSSLTHVDGPLAPALVADLWTRENMLARPLLRGRHASPWTCWSSFTICRTQGSSGKSWRGPASACAARWCPKSTS